MEIRSHLEQATCTTCTVCTASTYSPSIGCERLLRDIMGSDDLFGGKIMIFGGDFRQCLPVVPKGNRAAIVNASLGRSYMWPRIRKFRLKENVRARNGGPEAAEQQAWADQLQRYGEGTEPTVQIGQNDDYIRVPNDIAMPTENLDDLIEADFGVLKTDPGQLPNLSGRVILSTTNRVVDEINEKVMGMLQTPEVVYCSADSVPGAVEENLWPIEFLNGLNISGLPPHQLKLKVGIPVILLRNMDRYPFTSIFLTIVMHQPHVRLKHTLTGAFV